MNVGLLAASTGLVLLSLLAFRARPSQGSRPLPASAVTAMNWLRGLAAVSVLLGHVRGIFMRDFESLPVPTLPWKAFYLLSGMGHQAVVVFFVLSGFWIGSTVLAANAEGRFAFGPYALRRFSRLYVVLLPCLALTAFWDVLGMHLFGQSGIYAGALDARFLNLPDARITLSILHLAGSLAFLQHLYLAPFGTNGPLWSLSYEFWAYLLFPLLVRAAAVDVPRPRRLLLAVAAGALLMAAHWKLPFYFSIWLLGAGVAQWFRSAPARQPPLWLLGSAWLAFAGSIVLARASRLSDVQGDLLLGVATAVLVGLLLLRGEARASEQPPVTARAADWLANFSYTLYAAHYPLVTFVFAATTRDGKRLPANSGTVALVAAVSLAILFAYAYPLSRLTEAHTERVRRWLVARARPFGRGETHQTHRS